MRKHHDNKKKWTVLLVSGFIVFSMVISIFAIVVDNQDQGVPSYNKHSFIATNNGYKTKIDGKYMEFYTYPADVEKFNISSEILTKLRGSQGIGFMFDPKDNITDNLLYIDLIRYDLQLQIDKPTYFSITRDSDKYALPLTNCSSATNMFPIILINTKISSSEDLGFYIDPNYPDCIIMNAKLKDLLGAKDRLVYSYYGIMN